MQKGLVSYKLLSQGWDISDHLGDGFDLSAEKDNRFVKIELKAIDLNSIKKGNNATQHLSANEIVNASHLIITVFKGIELKGNYIMSMRQFVENSGVKKYNKYKSYSEFIAEYKKLALANSTRVKNNKSDKKRLNFDFSFNPDRIKKWKFSIFQDQWKNI